MIHYHGTPITPRGKLLELAGRCFCVSYAEPRDAAVCHELGQSVMLDNGAYSLWRAGQGRVDVGAYLEWAAPWLEHRSTWCVIPDAIDGSISENDRMIDEWTRQAWFVLAWQAAPVWHMHEPIGRLKDLAAAWPRVCLGSSGAYAQVGSAGWHRRMSDAMDRLCGDGPAPCWLHMLRGLKLTGGRYPFASADSTSIARNHAGNRTRNGAPRDPVRMAADLDGRQCPARWHAHEQLNLAD